MNIWVIGRSYPLPINNMQGSFELEQAKMLAKHGHNVSYIACIFHPFKKVKNWGYAAWEEDNITIYTYSQIYAIERMKIHLEKFQAMIWRKQLSRVEKDSGIPDVIHVHYPANITIANEVLKYQGLGSRIICTEHWSQVLTNQIDDYERKQLTKYVQKADEFLAVGKSLAEAVTAITKHNRVINIIPNIVNSVFEPTTIKNQKFTFVAIGVLFPVKQFDKVIISFGNAFKNNDEIQLLIIGDGPEYKKLSSIINENKLENRVSLMGRLSHNEIAKLLSKANALVCFSEYETFGVPVIEAWSCGLPTIVSEKAAVSDYCDKKLGIVVEPDKNKGLVMAMRQLFENYSDYNSEYIVKFCKENFSEAIIYNKLILLYEGNGGSQD